MRCRIIAPAGYHDKRGNSYRYGQIVDFSDDLAVKLLNHHIAVPAPPEPETAANEPPENMARRLSRPKAHKEEDRAVQEEAE